MPGVTEKWDLYVRGIELATGYSELVDPIIQRERFEAQARAAAADDEAMAPRRGFPGRDGVCDAAHHGYRNGHRPPTNGSDGTVNWETVLFPIVRDDDGN